MLALQFYDTIRYDTIGEFNVDSKAEPGLSLIQLQLAPADTEDYGTVVFMQLQTTTYRLQ